MSNLDPYKSLGVSKDSTQDDIKKAYRKLARKYHPDVNPDDGTAEQQFKEISEAYDILGDKEKRAEYDRLGQGQFYDSAFNGAGYERPDFDRGQSFEDMFGDLFGSGGHTRGGSFDFSSIFSQGQNGGFSQFRAGPQRGADQVYNLKISFDEAIGGTEKILQFDRQVQCGDCGGRGIIGNGTKSACTACSGLGQTIKKEKIKAKIPAGVDTGSKVRLAGKGAPGTGGAPAGDLFLQIEVAADRLFTRRGRDIEVETPVTLFEAVLGGRIEVPTPGGGRAALNIPAGTQSGQKFRLKGKGVLAKNGKTPGNMYVRVKVLLPEELDEEATGMFEKLKEIVPQDPARP